MFVSIRARSRASDQRLYGIVLNFGSFNPRSLASERPTRGASNARLLVVSIRARSRASDNARHGWLSGRASFNPRSLASERRDGIGGELAQGMFQSALARERRVD